MIDTNSTRHVMGRELERRWLESCDRIKRRNRIGALVCFGLSYTVAATVIQTLTHAFPQWWVWLPGGVAGGAAMFIMTRGKA